MKLTKNQLKDLINESYKEILNEAFMGTNASDQIRRELINAKLPDLAKLFKVPKGAEKEAESLNLKIEKIVGKAYTNFVREVLTNIKPLKKDMDKFYKGGRFS